MVNSTWTKNHISEIWHPNSLTIVYPPCDCKTFLQVQRGGAGSDEFRIVSVGQFRPEKDHRKQLEITRELVARRGLRGVKAVLIGSCRDEEDDTRVKQLKEYSRELGITDNVEFLVNASFGRLQEELGRGSVALHTMWNEHFGISLVECMASGCIMVAHKSGGPLTDIVDTGTDSRTGFLADTVEEFADCIVSIHSMSMEEREDIISRARTSIDRRFSVACFERELKRVMGPTLDKFSV